MGQRDWRVCGLVLKTLFLGYTNGYFDYLPTIRAISEGGQGAGDFNTYVAMGTADEVLRDSLVRIYEILGKWSELPEDLTRWRAGS